MNCQQFEQWLDDYLDGELSAKQSWHLMDHSARCGHCQRALARAQEVQQVLKSMPAPAVPEDYAEQQFQRLWVGQEKKTSKTGGHHALHVAVAASLLLGVMLGGGMMQWLSPSSPAMVNPAVTVSLYDTREVRFVVNSRHDLQGARVTLRIPAHLELEGYPGKQELSWTTNLKAGANLLSLPLRAAELGSGEVVMEINSANGKLAEKILVIESKGKRTTGGYRLEGIPG